MLMINYVLCLFVYERRTASNRVRKVAIAVVITSILQKIDLVNQNLKRQDQKKEDEKKKENIEKKHETNLEEETGRYTV